MQFKIFLAVVFPDGNQGEVLAWHLLPPQETTTQAQPETLQHERGSCGAAGSSRAWTCPHHE